MAVRSAYTGNESVRGALPLDLYKVTFTVSYLWKDAAPKGQLLFRLWYSDLRNMSGLRKPGFHEG